MHPKDPRGRPGHRERGPGVFRYTTDDIARVLGVSRRTVHNLTWSGRIDPASLDSIVAEAVRRRVDLEALLAKRNERSHADIMAEINALTKALQGGER